MIAVMNKQVPDRVKSCFEVSFICYRMFGIKPEKKLFLSCLSLQTYIITLTVGTLFIILKFEYTIICISIGTPKHNYPFGTNGKLMVLDSPTLGPLKKKDENGCVTIQFNPIALRISNTLRFGCAECNRVKIAGKCETVQTIFTIFIWL